MASFLTGAISIALFFDRATLSLTTVFLFFACSTGTVEETEGAITVYEPHRSTC